MVRGSIILHNGELLWPPPAAPTSTQTTAQAKAAEEASAATAVVVVEDSPFKKTLKAASIYGLGNTYTRIVLQETSSPVTNYVLNTP